MSIGKIFLAVVNGIFRVVKLAALLLCALPLLFVIGISCDARYTDASREPDHAERVGQRCMVLKGLKAHGVELDQRDVTHSVDVTTPPGIGGREITFQVDVSRGTEILIAGVRRCWNCPFGRIDYAIKIPELRQLAPYPVFARAETLEPDEARCVK